MSYRYRPPALPAVLVLALCGVAATASAQERIEQLAEDGVVTRYADIAPAKLAVPMTQVCEPGAKWVRLTLRELKLAPYDSLTLVSSAGERYTFEGDAWQGRGVSARALRGECVTLHPAFGSPDSKVRIESWQAGTQALEATPVVVAGAGDICDTDTAAPTRCKGTSDVIVAINPTAVFTAGDNAYSNGALTEYNSRYAPTWGRFKALTNPTPGNHEYNTSNASGYFDYFNGSGVQTGPAGDRSKGYYSWNVGDWHFIALNTMSAGTTSQAQLDWLAADLAANTKPCTAAYWHHPIVSRGNYTGYATVKPFWDRLYAARADLVLVGHDHNYQRYGLMNPSQAADANGIRQVLVGTGGRAFYGLSGSHPLLEASNANTHGVLKLTLTATGYTGEFVRSARSGNGTFTDSFNGSCHNATPPPNAPPVANFSVVTNALAATFTDASTDADGTIASRAWTFGDGATSTSANPTRNYAAAGTYSVSLTATDNGGATNTVTKTVTVTASGGACPGNSYGGSFSGENGQAQYQPTGGSYTTAASGTHKLCLNGPAGTDYDLYLDKRSGSSWSQVAKSEGTTSVESISYNGAAATYRVRVVNYRGTGAYTVTLQSP